jgi:hypothetical protein
MVRKSPEAKRVAALKKRLVTELLALADRLTAGEAIAVRPKLYEAAWRAFCDEGVRLETAAIRAALDREVARKRLRERAAAVGLTYEETTEAEIRDREKELGIESDEVEGL